MAVGGVVADLVVHVGADVADAESGLDSLNSKVEGSGANFGKASGVMAAGAGLIGAGLIGAITSAGDFEQVMNEVGVTSGATGAQFESLSNLAMDIGKNTVFSATEGAQAISELSKAGISTEDILNGAAMGAANLAAAGGVDMPRAAEVMSNAMNAFSIDGTRAADVADIFAGAANASAADVNSLAMGLSQVAPSAAGLGISLEDTVAQLALFSDYGMQGSDAGTSMKTMLSSLTPATEAARAAFSDLGLSTAESANRFFDASGSFVGMEAASGILYDSLKDLTDEQRATALETIFGSDASRAAEITFQAQKAAVEGTGQGYAGYRAAVEAGGQATDVANAKMAGMNGAIEGLKGSLETAGIVIGTAFTPVVEAAAEAVNSAIGFFLNLPAPVQTLISVVLAATAGILGLGSAFAFIAGPLLTMAPMLEGTGAAILGVAAPVAIVVAALAALYIAYQTNFLGFADGVNFAVEGVKGALSALGPLFTTVGDAINTFASAFTTGGLQAALDTLPGSLAAVGDAFGNLGTQITDHLTNIDWSNVMANFGTKGQEFLTALGNGIIASLPIVLGALLTISTAIPNALIAVGPTLLAKGGELIGQLIAGIIAKSPDVTAGLQTLSNGMAEAFNTAGEALLTKGSELIGSLKTGIDQKWPEVTAWLGTVAGLATTALGTLAETFLAQGIELLQGLKDGVDQKWPEIPGFLATAAGLVVTALGTLAETFKPAGTALITGLKTAIDAAWPQIPGWLATVGSLAVAAIGDLAATLGPAGTALITGIYTAATEYWPTVSAWIDTIASLAVTAIGDLIATLEPAGTALLTGLKTGIDAGWSIALAWFQSLPGLITGAIGDLGGILYNAGASIITGLIDGIGSQIGNLTSKLGEVTSLIPLSKGPPAKDAKLLFDSGQLIMQGLIDGIDSKIEPLRNTLEGITADAQDIIGESWTGTTFFDEGSDAAMGLLDGFTSAADEIRSGIQAMIDDIRGQVEAGISGIRDEAEAAANEAANGGDYSDTGEKTKENDKAQRKSDRRAGRSPATSTTAAADDGLTKQEQRQQDREDKRAARDEKKDNKSKPTSTSSQLSSVASKVTPTGPITIYQSNMFTIDIKKLEDMIEAGKFIRDLEPTRSIYLEVSE